MYLILKKPVSYHLQVLDNLAAAAIALLYVVGAYIILLMPTSSWVNLLTDDAYYYLGIARNFADSGNSYFLPPHQTNGYQPLWQLIIITSGYLFGTSEKSLVLQAYTLSFLFTAGFAILSKKIYGFAFPAIAVAAFFPGVMLRGMETTMLPLLIIAYFAVKDWKARGVLSSLIFLSRLDALAFIVTKDLYFYVFKEEQNLKHYTVLFPVILTYFLFNYLTFGTPLPLSGLSKSVGNRIGENIHVAYEYLNWMKPVLIVYLTVFIGSLVFKHPAALKFKDQVLVTFFALIGIAGYYVVFSSWGVWEWYAWPSMLLYYYGLLAAAALVVESHDKSFTNRRITAYSLLFFILLFTLIPAAGWSKNVVQNLWKETKTFGTQNIALAKFIRETFSQGAYFAMGDRAGSFGFFLGSDYRFLHTEGLVGPYEYYQQVSKDKGIEFLRNENIEYLIAERDRFFEDENIIGVAEPIQGRSAHTGPYLICFDKNAIVLDQSYYLRNGVLSKRYMFNMTGQVPCPLSMTSHFQELREEYGELRRFSLYSEYPQP